MVTSPASLGPDLATVAAIRTHLDARPPTLGGGRLVCIDGPAGSGKTTLADALVAAAGQPVRLLHMDDLYPGWQGLPEVDPVVLGILAPLAQGEPGRYRRYDWYAAARAEEHLVEPAPLVVLEGVGAGNAAWAPWITTLVWVEADPALRLERGVARDGEHLRPELVRWQADEQIVLTAQRTRERADLVVET